jgi:hypothetical protein
MLDSMQTDTPEIAQETYHAARLRHAAMTPVEFKTYSDRLRRIAWRQGLILQKSRSRDPQAKSYKGYTLTDLRTCRVVLGRRKDDYLPELADIEKFLLGRELTR